MSNPLAIVQARMGSTRLPGKVLRPILGHPMLWHIVQRVRKAPGVTEVVVATGDRSSDDAVAEMCRSSGIAVFRGNESDVLDRFYQAARQFQGDPLLRITGDCPFADPELIGRVLAVYQSGSYDHVGVATGAGAIYLKEARFPDGLDAECFSLAALERAWREATDPRDREHVTPYIWRNKHLFRCGHVFSEQDLSNLRWTVDNEVDFRVVSEAYHALYDENRPFLMKDILAYLATRTDLAAANRDFIGKEGYAKLWDVQ